MFGKIESVGQFKTDFNLNLKFKLNLKLEFKSSSI